MKNPIRQIITHPVETPSGTINVRSIGTGFPLLMVHGLFVSSNTFDEFLPFLPEEAQGIAIDLPGQGDSKMAPDFKPSWESLASSVIETADALGLEKFDLLGHSMGGGISILVAATYPERVRKLVLVDSVSYPFELPFKGKLLLTPLLGRAIFSMYKEKMFTDYFAHDVFHDATKLNAEKVQKNYNVLNRSRRDQLECIKATSDPSPVAKQVSALKSETLVVWGEHDALVPNTIGDRLHETIKDSSFVTIYNSGHSPLEEQPEVTANSILKFLYG